MSSPNSLRFTWLALLAATALFTGSTHAQNFDKTEIKTEKLSPTTM